MKDSENNDPFGSPEENDIRRLLNNDFHAYVTIIGKLDDLIKETRKNNLKLDELEETVSYFAYIPKRGFLLRYDHKKQDLYFQRNLSMHFEGKEADILSIMFKKKDGRPHKKKFQVGDVFEKFQNERRDFKSPKAISLTVSRIQTKIDLKYRLGTIFVVTTKEFYFSRKHQSKIPKIS